MRAFIQCNKVKDLVTDSYILTPINPNVYNAYYGLREMGYECVMFETYEDLLAYYHSKSEIICGGIGMIRRRLQDFNINCDEINYPEELKSYLKRNIWESTINEVRDNEKTWPIFVKSVEGKRLTGKVISKISDLIGCGCSEENYSVLCSIPVNMETEYRVFVRYGKILGVKLYKGNPFNALDENIVMNCIKDFTSSPNAYGIDFAVTDKGETILIEVNDGYALGSYGLEFYNYAKLIITRWAELTNTVDEYYYI